MKTESNEPLSGGKIEVGGERRGEGKETSLSSGIIALMKKQAFNSFEKVRVVNSTVKVLSV